jgi:hypothetical protein
MKVSRVDLCNSAGTLSNTPSQNAWLIAIISMISTSSIKISVLLFYRRIVKELYGRIKYSLWVAISFVVMFSITLTVWELVQCSPIHSVWLTLDPTYNEPHQGLSRAKYQIGTIVISALSVVTDFVTVTLPAILIFTQIKMTFTLYQHIALITIFGLGYL